MNEKEPFDVRKIGKKTKFRFSSKQGLCYLELNNSGKFYASSDNDLKSGIGLDKKENIDKWLERWADKK